MEKKTTKKDCVKMLLNMAEVQSNAECVKYLEHELELLENRHSNGEKAKEKTKEQESLMKTIKGFLEENSENSFTATEIMRAAFPDTEISVQKVTALLKKMLEKDIIVKIVVKKTARFQIMDTGVEEEDNGDVEGTGEDVED